MSVSILASPTITGLWAASGSRIITDNAMGALAVNVAQAMNTVPIAADSTLTNVGSDTADAYYSLRLTNTDTNSHTITIPSSISANRGGAITNFTIGPSSETLLTFMYDGTNRHVFGDPTTINDLSADAAPNGALNYLEEWNASTQTHQKVLLNNLPGAGGGTVTHTAGALTLNAPLLGAGAADTKVVAGITSDGISKLTLGVSGTSVGGISFLNATSGSVSISPPTGALGTTVLNPPATGTTDTFAVVAAAQTFTNKRNTARATVASIATGTLTINSDNTDIEDVTATGAFTIGAPSGTPTDRQQLQIAVLASGTSPAVTFNSIFDIPSSSSQVNPVTITSGTVSLFAFQYSTLNSKWLFIASIPGY